MTLPAAIITNFRYVVIVCGSCAMDFTFPATSSLLSSMSSLSQQCQQQLITFHCNTALGHSRLCSIDCVFCNQLTNVIAVFGSDNVSGVNKKVSVLLVS